MGPKRGRFWIKVIATDKKRISKGLLSPQLNTGKSCNEKQAATINDIIEFLKKYDNKNIEFDLNEELYKVGNLYYNRQQLIYKANKLRENLGKKLFKID